eukprot:m.297064 g.297064  ORF g.297064 m.297064 type:complete len:268 (+) comp20074_c0_seq4:136-939(+)
MMTSALQELSIEDLENTLEQAQQRYARLRAQASKRAFKNVLQTYEGEKLSLPQSSTSNENTASQISDKAAKNSKRRRVEATHVAYRIAGHTIFPVAPHKSGIRFDTSCFGKYHEQYYVFLHFADDTTVTVFKHTLPPFIRVEEQAKDLHTDAGLKKFMLEISTNLNAYVHRREQVRQLEHKHKGIILNNEIVSSPAFDYVKFTIENIWSHRTDDDDMPEYFVVQVSILMSTNALLCVLPHCSGTKKNDNKWCILHTELMGSIATVQS